ncbi:uncharacterized protein LOC125021230 isoform X2 [Mugil cephalus]|nr:uncharacterized protein LOC125021230 isoform X2 [Mugil cephalus]
MTGELDGCFSIMLKSLFVFELLAVLLISVKCEPISVCIEDDDDLRVDCRIDPKPSQINSYEFSWSYGSKEVLINTNVSGSSAEVQFKDKSSVEELDPHGYRMTLTGFRHSLPHNTTYICKISGSSASITVEKDHLIPCSAMSMIQKNSWYSMACLLLLLYTQLK